MKFNLTCTINDNNKHYYAVGEGGRYRIYNVILSDKFDHNTLGCYCDHEFIIVVNKRGQLSCLCIQ